ncbi:hypothetical protein NHQ30_011684 [Ciborinia camelliae]|nr:hypothetical protein NHQ30_011684 [Ciborinia camelliae]
MDRSVTSMDHFRFLDLPGGIRNDIYKMVLCDVLDPELSDGPESERRVGDEHNIHPQLLRTCHQIHDEAKYVMTMTNRFVEVQFVTGTRLNFGFLKMAQLSTVPILRIKKNIPIEDVPIGGIFDGCVMRHKVSSIGGSRWEERICHSILVLHRHMDRLLAAIMQTQWFTAMLNSSSNTVHEITLLNPFLSLGNGVDFLGQNSNARPFSIEPILALREHFLSPYSRVPQEGSEITINDNTTDTPRDALVERIPMPLMTAESVMRDLHQLKQTACDYVSRGSYGYAEDYFCLADYKISVLMNKSNRLLMALFEKEGPELENQLGPLYHSICLHRAKIAVAMMEVDKSQNNRKLKEQFDLVKTMAAHAQAPTQFESFTPTPSQAAEILWLEARAYRLMGDRRSTHKAMLKIESAIAMSPDNDTFKEERDRIQSQIDLEFDHSFKEIADIRRKLLAMGAQESDSFLYTFHFS